VRYEADFYIEEDGILHGHRRVNLKPYIALTGWAVLQFEINLKNNNQSIMNSNSS
jgi:hypothetical protein